MDRGESGFDTAAGKPLAEDADMRRRRGGRLATALVILALCLVMALLWQTASTLLTIFAGVLFASFLDAAARALAPVVPLGRAWRLTLVVLLLLALSAVGVIWGAGKIPGQVHLVVDVMSAQIEVVQGRLLSFGVDLLGPEAGRNFARWFLDQGRLFNNAQMVLGGATSFVANTLLILFLGILFAYDPAGYRDSVVLLVPPPHRARCRAVMDEMGSVLRQWFIGLLIRIVLMTVMVWVALSAIGLPGPLILGVQAGLSNFIPYLGPIIAMVPIILVAMPLGGSVMLWAVVIYTVIQSIEGYVIGPLIQREVVASPAWALVAVPLLGTLFGIMGIALAMPLVAVGRVAIIRFYVEDYLGDIRGKAVS